MIRNMMYTDWEDRKREEESERASERAASQFRKQIDMNTTNKL